jgi:hypothetical protein
MLTVFMMSFAFFNAYVIMLSVMIPLSGIGRNLHYSSK